MTGRPPSYRSFKIQKDSQGSHIEVRISEVPGLKAENLGLATWGSSFVLANLLHRWKVMPTKAQSVSENATDLTVLELGAGTSLVGISAAAIWQMPVVVTDLAPLVAGLAQNAEINHELLLHSPVLCGELDWSQPSVLQLQDNWQSEDGSRSELKATEHKFQIILAADTVYAEDHPSLLTSTIQTWLKPGSDARVILCYVLRHSYIDIIRDLWEQFGVLGLECIEEGRQDANPDLWDDVAPFEWGVWRWRASARNGAATGA